MPGSVPAIPTSSQLFVFTRGNQVFTSMGLWLGRHAPSSASSLTQTPMSVSCSGGQVVQSSFLIYYVHGCLLATILPWLFPPLKCWEYIEVACWKRKSLFPSPSLLWWRTWWKLVRTDAVSLESQKQHAWVCALSAPLEIRVTRVLLPVHQLRTNEGLLHQWPFWTWETLL